MPSVLIDTVPGRGDTEWDIVGGYERDIVGGYERDIASGYERDIVSDYLGLARVCWESEGEEGCPFGSCGC